MHKSPLRATSCLGEVFKINEGDKEQFDPHYRILAVVYVNETDLNEKMVREGYAEVIYISPSEFYYYDYEWKP